MYQTSVIYLIIIITNVHFALASTISHPPAYEQIKQSYKNGDRFDTDLYEDLKYNAFDINLLKRQKNISYIVAIAYQLDRSEAINLLMSYLPEIRTNYLGLSLLISCALREDKLNKKLPIENLSKELIKQSPNNGYAYYVMAYYYAKTNNFDNCINCTKKAVNSSEDLKKHLKTLTESLSKISEMKDIPEKRWEKYYDDLYGKSERYAIKKLMSEYPLNIK